MPSNNRQWWPSVMAALIACALALVLMAWQPETTDRRNPYRPAPSSPAAISIHPLNDSYSNYLVGFYAQHLNDFKAAANGLYHAHLAGSLNSWTLPQAYGATLEAGLLDQAQDLALDLASSGQLSYWSRIHCAMAFMKAGRYAQVRALLSLPHTESIDDKQQALGDIVRAWSWVASNDWQQALMILQPGNHPINRFHQALILNFVGEKENARFILRQTPLNLWLTPVFRPLYRGVVGLDDPFDQHDLLKPTPLTPSNINNWTMAIGNPHQGLAAALLQTGWLAYSQGHHHQALRYGWLSIDLDKTNGQAYFLLGRAYEALGAYGTAYDLYTYLDQDPQLGFSATLSRSAVKLRQGDNNQALKLLDDVNTRAVDDISQAIIAKQRADIYFYIKHYDQAIKAYSQSLRLLTKAGFGQSEKLKTMLYPRGLARQLQGDITGAEHDLKRALALQPDNATLMNALAYLWLEQNTQIAKAFQLLERALALDPNNGHILDSYGLALLRLGKASQAVIYLEQAAQILPTNPNITEHLGDAYGAMGQHRQAVYQWRKTLHLNVPHNQRPTIVKKINTVHDNQIGGYPQD